ncbi:MAG: hypothetical protein AAF141_02190 [Pseudomonadota bacterium]
MVVLVAAYIVLAPMRMSVIIDRQDEVIELYFGLPARGLSEVFALPISQLPGESSAVDFAKMREGTWDLGDASFQSVATSLGGKPVEFEAMSMMVHPDDERLPFRNALDGTLAVSVCGIPIPQDAQSVQDLYAYAGFIAMSKSTRGDLNFDFLRTGRLPVLVDISDFANGRLVKRSWSVLWDGGSISS